MKASKVLFADTASHDTLPEMPGLFVRAGYNVDVLCTKNSWLRRNGFVNKWILAAPTDEQYVIQIIKLVRTGGYDWIILGDDYLVRIMNQVIRWDDPIAEKILPLCNMGSREVLGSKIGLMNSCLKFGIKIPKSVVSVQKGCISDARQIGYPLLVKSDYGHSGTGVIKCTSEAELILATGAFENDEKFLIQEYIDGDIINTESLFKNGKLLGYAYSKTIETITDEFGVSAVRAYHVFPEITPVLEKIGRVIGVNGFVNMTFMRDRMTGEHFLIEADVRPQAWVPLARFAGVDFAEAIKSYSYDPEHFKVVIPLLGTPEKPLIIRHFSRDMMRCIIHHNGREVWNWVINKDFRWRFIPWYDPVLLFWTLGRILKFWLGRLMR